MSRRPAPGVPPPAAASKTPQAWGSGRGVQGKIAASGCDLAGFPTPRCVALTLHGAPLFCEREGALREAGSGWASRNKSVAA